MSKRAKQLILASAVPILVLLGMAVLPLYTLLNGVEIMLQTRPVDPSDPFRGDYVNLSYQAEQVPKELVEADVVRKVEHGSGQVPVYVLLEKKNGVHVPVNVSLKKPASGIYLKGRLDYISPSENQKVVAYIQYSLDKYFVEDDTGRNWEDAASKGGLLAKVKVFNGYAYLTDIVK
ncbi:GDYXXLXY domain-containing protein [Neobacillus sp. SM06]|uniref:GDYXXLXY domain-containing protein n=1 Tax=Neobacillus sp. SM06 TaxID=3422492 RepID=UPI003D2B48FE